MVSKRFSGPVLWPGTAPWSFLSVAQDAWRATRGGPRAIAARQQARLADLVAMARACSPYYRHLYRHLPPYITDVHQLPPVTKPDLMAHFDDWVTDPAVTRAGVESFIADRSLIGQLYLGRYLVWTTSGTTGVPAILVHDLGAWTVYNALSYVRAFLRWIGLRDLGRIVRGGARSAGLIVTGGHYGGIVMAERARRERPWRSRMLRIFSVLSPLPELVRELNEFQPVVIAGYATAIALLAREQEAGRLRIRPVLAATTAESIPPTMRRQIAAAFGCPVWDAYAASEVGAIAFDCGRGWLHVNADWVIVEPVDDAYRPVPPGQPSHTVLVTDLANRVQPIIRYDLGDSITESPSPCPCGSPLPAIHVEGRTDEVLAFPSPTGETVHLLPMALATVVEETPGVHRYQVVQTGPTSLEVRLEVAPKAQPDQVWEAVKGRLREYLAKQGLTTVTVERGTALPMRDPRTGKFRHVWAERRSQDILAT